MSVSSSTSRVSYAGNGSTTVFAVPFKFFANGDLVVILQTSGVDTVQTINTHYTVSGAGSESGGSVTFLSPPGGTTTVIIYRDPAITQTTDYTEGDAFPVETVEQALDRLTMIAQRNRSLTERSPALVEGDTDGSGRYDFNNNRGINCSDPVDSQDVATKNWVASQILAGALADYSGTVTAFGASLLDDANASAALTTLGVTAFAKTILDDANAAATQTTLGISAFIQTLMDDVDAATARATLGVTTQPEPNPNLLLNPDFQLWRLGTTIDGSTTPNNNDGNYIADGCILLSSGNDIVDITKETSIVPSRCNTALKATCQTTNQKFGFFFPIENALSTKHANQTVSFSCQARMSGSGNLSRMRIGLLSWASPGVADSITRDVVSAWAVEGTNPTLVSNWTFINTPGLLTLTTAYQSFSVVNQTVPSGCLNLGVFIWLDDTAYTSGDAFYLSAMKLEVGTAATTFHSQRIEDVEAQANRLYYKTFARETAPVNNAGTAGALEYVAVGTGAGSAIGYSWRFPVTMRVAPTVTTYNPGSGTAGYWMRELPSGGAVVQAGADRIGPNGCRIYNVAAASSAYMYSIHAVADARL